VVADDFSEVIELLRSTVDSVEAAGASLVAPADADADASE